MCVLLVMSAGVTIHRMLHINFLFLNDEMAQRFVRLYNNQLAEHALPLLVERQRGRGRPVLVVVLVGAEVEAGVRHVGGGLGAG